MSGSRFVRDFQAPADPWPVVERWASDQGYVRVGGTEARSYRKGAGVAVGARMLQIGFDDGHGHLEAWVAANGLARLFSLYLLPREITIEPGGMKAVLPRTMGRREVDPLLQALGQPPVGASGITVAPWTDRPAAGVVAASTVASPAPVSATAPGETPPGATPGSATSLPPAPLPGPPAPGPGYGPPAPAWSAATVEPERRRAAWRLPVALVLLLVVAGITIWKAVSPPSMDERNVAATRGETYETPRALVDAMGTAGVPCTAFVKGEDTPGALGSTISRSASCTLEGEGVTMTVFARGPTMKELLATWVTTYLQGMETFGGTSFALVGPNWIVTATDEGTLFRIQDAIGGKLRT